MLDSPELPRRELDPISERCFVELYNPEITPWKQIQDEVMAIEHEVWGEDGFDEDDMTKDFDNKDYVAIVIKDGKKIVGYTTAQPLSAFKQEDWQEGVERADGGQQTAYIDNTNLLAQYRGHHLVWKAMDLLDETLADRRYRFLERDASTANNYATNIKKRNANRILAEQPHDSEYGPQVFYRMTVPGKNGQPQIPQAPAEAAI